jgi:hypothetical protein
MFHSLRDMVTITLFVTYCKCMIHHISTATLYIYFIPTSLLQKSRRWKTNKTRFTNLYTFQYPCRFLNKINDNLHVTVGFAGL